MTDGIVKTLMISTAHLPEQLGASALDTTEGLCIDQIEAGWIVYVPGQKPYGVIPLDLARVLVYAHEQGCRFIHFQADNDTIDALPTWDW